MDKTKRTLLMSKINLEQLKADRAAGEAGPWRVIPCKDSYRISYNELGNWLAEVYYDEDSPDPEVDARRIARLPDLELAYIEAMEALAARPGEATVERAAMHRQMKPECTTTDLVTRIESAAPDEQEKLLLEAYDHCPHAWKGGNALLRFEAMLDAEAYVDAALMLVPSGDGLHWLLGLTKSGKGLATIWKNDTPFGEQGQAATPALALLAAILKAGR